MSDLQGRLDRLAALPEFEGARVKCPCRCHKPRPTWPHSPSGCPICHGAGFTGSRDLAVWLASLRKLDISYLLDGDDEGVVADIWLPGISGILGDILCPDELEALVAALEKAKDLGPLDAKEKQDA